MGLPVEVNNLMMGSLGGYTIGRSLRFRASASAYLNRTPASATNQTTWTWSGWVKKGNYSSYGCMFGAYTGAGATYTVLQWQNDNTLVFYNQTSSSITMNLNTTAVYRDPSAWYHIVAVYDSTQATSTNRAKIYVNGSQVTSFSTATYPSLNQVATINSVVPHDLGRFGGALNYFDGYLAEVNFIDGQALTPSSFGSYDTNGVWQPKKYTGTYGTNGFYLPFDNTSSTTGGNICTYSEDISNAAYVKNNATVTTNSTTAPNGTTTADTLTEDTANSTHRYYNPIGTTTNGVTYTFSVYAKANTRSAIALEAWNGSTAKYAYADLSNVAIISGSDASAAIVSVGNGWYRISVSHTGVGLSGSSIAVYLMNSATAGAITYTGNGTGSVYLWGNQVEVASSVGPYFATQASTIPSSLRIALDSSSNASASGGYGNHWATNNISLTAGTTYDSMIDSPTVSASASNYAVLNPLYIQGATAVLSDGNLQSTTGTTGTKTKPSTIAVSSGQWYWEVTPTAGSGGADYHIGIANADFTTTAVLGSTSTEYSYAHTAVKRNNNTSTAYGATYTTNDIIGVALDLDGGTLTYYKNGVSQGQAFSGISGTYVAIAGDGSTAQTSTFVFNFGQRPFSYTPPSGFKALNTYNLPAPSIANGAQYMAATTYTGNGGTQSIVNSGGFQPDFVWIKDRSAVSSHQLFDSIRGAGTRLYSNLTNGEDTNINSLSSFNSNGFSLGNVSGTNASGDSFIGWQWKAGGTGVTNNSGTITSTVSANPTAGFSIVTYTGTGALATVGHGLGVAPNMIIWKNRSAVQNWVTYHSSLGATGNVYLNLTAGFSADSTTQNNTAPTSSVFTVATSGAVNGSTNNLVAYCFAAVDGYSAFGKYTGNGSSTDGPFVFTGFRPRWVMIKNTQDGTTNWYIYDTSRDTYNIASSYLMSNLSNAEASFSAFDILSNGFKIRTSNLNFNNSGQTHIYVAFAESPFKYSRAR
jgi:hypothetical protein